MFLQKCETAPSCALMYIDPSEKENGRFYLLGSLMEKIFFSAVRCLILHRLRVEDMSSSYRIPVVVLLQRESGTRCATKRRTATILSNGPQSCIIATALLACMVSPIS